MKIAYVGTNGFPYGTAPVKKQELITKTLNESVFDVLIISRFGIHNESFPTHGVWNGIKYKYTCPSTKRKNNKILNYISKKIGSFYELIFLLFYPFDFLISNNRSFLRTILYILIAKIKRKKIVLTVVEDNNAVLQYTGKLGKLNTKLFNRYVWKLIDGCLPISHFLYQKVLSHNPSLKTQILPVLVDYKLYDKISVSSCEHFVFCGSLAYFETIEFIIESYKKSNVKSKLLLIINGSSYQKNKLKDFIKHKGLENKIIIKCNLSDIELIKIYKSALTLLIPLRKTIQDQARFPHKLGEYCASQRPIISSNIGEVKKFFTHKQDAILLNRYTTKEFADSLLLLEQDIQLRESIAKQSYILGKKHFDYKNYIEPLKDFLIKL